MSTCGSYTTALAFWATRCEDTTNLPRCGASVVQDFTASIKDSVKMRRMLVDLGALPEESAEPPRPKDGEARNRLHLSVPDRAQRRHPRGTVAHAITGQVDSKRTFILPSNSFCRIGEDAFVASPELTYYQMASRARYPYQAIEAGYVLCSAFAFDPVGHDRVARRVPPTSVVRIATFLEKLPGVWGVEKAREYLRFVHDGCDSPPEIQLSMELAMPRSLGGRQWPRHECAREFPLLEERYQRMLGSQSVRADIYLPDYDAILEYDSYENHMGKWDFDHTNKRAEILRADLHKVIPVTHGMVMNSGEFDDAIWVWEEEIGIPHAARNRHTAMLQRDLHETLVAKNRRWF